MINKYGHKMTGLQNASKATADWPENCGFCSVVRYDPAAGKVWTSEISVEDLAGKYDVFRTVRHVSAQYIADQIAEHIRMANMTPQTRYDKKNIVQVSLRLSRKYDADILDLLDKQDNKQGYIKKVLREQIK